MNPLVERVSNSVGIDAATAEKAIGIMLNFLMKEGPADKVGKLVEDLPGADDMLAAQSADTGGGMFGGGLMAVAGQLQGIGLDMGQIQGVAKETMGYAREHGDGALVDEIAQSVPGLSQFV